MLLLETLLIPRRWGVGRSLPRFNKLRGGSENALVMSMLIDTPDRPSGNQVTDMLGMFIESAVQQAVSRQIAEQAKQGIEDAVSEQIERLRQASVALGDKLEIRAIGIAQNCARNLEKEADQILEKACHRIAERRQEILDDMQEPVMELMLESQELFRERATDYLEQLKDEQTLAFAAAIKSMRTVLLAETETASQMICDRNLSEFSGQFELQVDRCFQGVAENLAAPVAA